MEYYMGLGPSYKLPKNYMAFFPSYNLPKKEKEDRKSVV